MKSRGETNFSKIYAESLAYLVRENVRGWADAASVFDVQAGGKVQESLPTAKDIYGLDGEDPWSQ